MGAIEETRQVLQDFLAPELRGIAARLDALEQSAKQNLGQLSARVDGVERNLAARIDQLENRIDRLENSFTAGLDKAEQRSEQRHQAVLLAIGSLTNYSALAERVTRIEAERRAKQ